MSHDALLKALSVAGHADHTAAVEALLRPAVFLRGTRLAASPARAHGTLALLDQALAALPLGASRFGGLPDLPPGVPWPCRDGIPMEFVAQIRLADAAPHDAGQLLPRTGSLLFFFNSQWSTFDQDQDPTSCAVLFHDGPDAALVRTPAPQVEFLGDCDDVPRLAPDVHGLASLAFSPFEMVPGGVSPWIGDGDPLSEFWQDFTADHTGDHYPSGTTPYKANHLLGYIDAQDYCGAHRNGTDDQLLLQVDSDACAGFQWGDCARLYFVVRRDALAARDFSQVRVYSLLG